MNRVKLAQLLDGELVTKPLLEQEPIVFGQGGEAHLEGAAKRLAVGLLHVLELEVARRRGVVLVVEHDMPAGLLERAEAGPRGHRAQPASQLTPAAVIEDPRWGRAARDQ